MGVFHFKVVKIDRVIVLIIVSAGFLVAHNDIGIFKILSLDVFFEEVKVEGWIFPIIASGGFYPMDKPPRATDVLRRLRIGGCGRG